MTHYLDCEEDYDCYDKDYDLLILYFKNKCRLKILKKVFIYFQCY